MSRKVGIALVAAVVVAGVWNLFGVGTSSEAGQQAAGRLLSGVVRSSAGEPLEGATISAVVLGTPVTTSVFTDARGGYYFPPMAAGRYRVRAQAPGYQKMEATVDLDGIRRQDFTIALTSDYFLHLTGDQAMASWPEDTPARRRMKDVFLRNCTGCHEANIALQNRFDQRGWEAIIDAMSRLSTAGIFAEEDRPPNAALQYFKKDLSTFLAEMRGPESPQPALPPRLRAIRRWRPQSIWTAFDARISP